MTVVKLMGGLGNQLFQYAYGRTLELSGKKVVFDISFFKNSRSPKDTARNFKLDKFNIQTNADFFDKRHLFSDLYDKIRRRAGFKVENYFQSEKYFINIADTIRREFTLKRELSAEAQKILQKIENANAVSLHVRRGDYVNDRKTNAYHGVCGMDYYQAAMKLMKEKISNPIFFIFSDDIAWAKANFSGDNIIFVSNYAMDDMEELFLMSRCRYHITANSSFSWWGAWLNPDPSKVVIAPAKWFKNEAANNNDIIPENWIKI